MRAIILNESGDVSNLQLTEIEKPTINNDEVLVKVVSIGINPVDVNARAYQQVLNWIFSGSSPVILGWDISGEVVEIGKNVTEFKLGDQVFGMINFFGAGNAYAEYVACPKSHLAVKPTNVTHQQAAASAMVGSTAYQALVDVANVKKGDKVLIHGASGGVGHMAIQIAKYFGAYVIGTSSAKNRAFVMSLGADEHIDYTTENFEDRVHDADIILDTIQGDTLLRSIESVRIGGTIVTIPTPEIPKGVQDKAKEKQAKVEFMMVSSKNETIKSIAKLLENKALTPNIHKSFPFEQIGDAHTEVATKRVVGKIVVNTQ